MTVFAHPLVLALLHGGHGHDGDSPSLLLRLKHVLTEPAHLMPVLLAAFVVAATVVVIRHKDDSES